MSLRRITEENAISHFCAASVENKLHDHLQSIVSEWFPVMLNVPYYPVEIQCGFSRGNTLKNPGSQLANAWFFYPSLWSFQKFIKILKFDGLI